MAFDAIDHHMLLRKLSIYEIDGNSLKWFEAYLSNHSQKCKVNDHLPQAKQIAFGVRQGSILGPLLFLFYIINHPTCVKKAASRMYADDTNIALADSDLKVLGNEMNNELRIKHKYLAHGELVKYC